MAKSPNIELVLIRSGRTDWDDAHRVQGQTDLPLCANAASEVAPLLEEHLAPLQTPPAVIYHAPDEASAETARAAATIAGRGGAVRTKPIANLAAVGMGLWEGLLEDELAQRYPTKFKAWREDPSAVIVPEGEGLVDGQARILGALARLAEKSSLGPLAVVLRPNEYEVVSLLIEGKALRERPSPDAFPPVRRWTLPRVIFADIGERLIVPAA